MSEHPHRSPTRRRKKGPLHRVNRTLNRAVKRVIRLINRLPLPDLGPWTQIIGAAGLLTGTLAISLVVGIVLRAMIVSDSFNPFRAEGAALLPTATPFATPNPSFQAPTLAAEPWQSTDRVTVLLLGADTRPAERGFTRPRTDSIMLLMADPEMNVASVLSIPRDLYVDIPGHGLNRINTAYVWGGGDLAMQTIEYNFGVEIDYYVLVEFDAFIQFVDELGGIDVYVPRAINDTSYPDMDYGYDPFYIDVGEHHMDGETALKYARTRHGDSDFQRAQRQQDILFAIRDRILSFDMLPTLIQRAPNLYAALEQNIQTNMTLEEMLSLAQLAKDIPRDNIRSGVIDQSYTSGYTTAEGAMVLIPERDKIGGLLEEVFWLGDDDATAAAGE
jgi:LCP family protein required for cell wall assembly